MAQLLAIGARMRERRLALEISQDQLGKELGVSFKQIQKYEAVKTASARRASSRSAKP
jgi:transcriptional regulator with XRE-family HTH domain